jgi:hypothetical protein
LELRYKKISWKGGSRSPLFAILLFLKEKLSESGDMRQVMMMVNKKKEVSSKKKENNMHSEMNLELRYEEN